MNSFLNFLAFNNNISKIKDIEIIKPLETKITIKDTVQKYKSRFLKIKWVLKETGKGVYPVLSMHKIKVDKRTKSLKITKKKKKKKPYEHTLRPSLLPPKKQYSYDSY